MHTQQPERFENQVSPHDKPLTLLWHTHFIQLRQLSLVSTESFDLIPTNTPVLHGKYLSVSAILKYVNCPSVCLHVSINLFVSIYLSIYLSICLSIYLSIHSSFHSSIYLSIATSNFGDSTQRKRRLKILTVLIYITCLGSHLMNEEILKIFSWVENMVWMKAIYLNA